MDSGFSPSIKETSVGDRRGAGCGAQSQMSHLQLESRSRGSDITEEERAERMYEPEQ